MLDPEVFLFMNRDKKDGNLLFDLLLIVLIVPILKYCIENFKEYLPTLFKLYYFKKVNEVIFQGRDREDYGRFYSDYPLPMLAIFNWTIYNKKSNKIKFFNVKNNNDNICFKSKNKETLTILDFIIEDALNIMLKKDLYLDIIKYKQDESTTDKKSNVLKTSSIIIKLKSKKYNIEEINEFVNKCIIFNKEYEDTLNKNKLYHFIYKGSSDDHDFKDRFLTSVLSDKNDPLFTNNKSFDTMHFKDKKKLINDLDRLERLDYYKKTGISRKLGLLLYGPPGCGKTGSVIASAIYTNRHIIEVPMSRLKKNSDIEELFNLTKIGSVEFNNNNIIILLDEIDQIGSSIQKRDHEIEKNEKNKNKDNDKDKDKDKDKDNENDKEKEKEKESDLSIILKEYVKVDTCKSSQDDNINLGILLSRLDGVGNYDGLIIIATTNCIDKLSNALYRDGRLNKIEYNYAYKEDIIKIIEQFYNVKLTLEQINKIPDTDKKISHSTIIRFIQDNEQDIENLLVVLENIKNIS